MKENEKEKEKESDVMLYFLISRLNPPKKIFELINTSNQEIYLQAHEILNNYMNLQYEEDIKSKRIKIPLKSYAFHILITKEDLIFISYSNSIYLSSESNFDLFEEINDYLSKNVKRKVNEEHSFLVEDEKEEIKDIISCYIEDFSFLDSLNTIQTENGSEQNKINNDKNKDNDILRFNNKNEKNKINNGDKKENSKGNLLKNTIVLNKSTNPQFKSNTNLKNSSRFKSLSKSINLRKSKINNNKIKFKLDEETEKKKIEKKEKITNYNKMNLYNDYKPDCCSKSYIIAILAFIVAIEIIATVLIIYFSDISK